MHRLVHLHPTLGSYFASYQTCGRSPIDTEDTRTRHVKETTWIGQWIDTKAWHVSFQHIWQVPFRLLSYRQQEVESLCDSLCSPQLSVLLLAKHVYTSWGPAEQHWSSPRWCWICKCLWKDTGTGRQRSWIMFSPLRWLDCSSWCIFWLSTINVTFQGYIQVFISQSLKKNDACFILHQWHTQIQIHIGRKRDNCEHKNYIHLGLYSITHKRKTSNVWGKGGGCF